MAARLKLIRIPKTPASAFDKHREISDLVRNQVRHAHQELHEWWKRVGTMGPDQIRTEQEAAEYIRIVTGVLHPEGVPRRPMKVRPAPKSGVWLHDPSAQKGRPPKRRARTARRSRR